MFDFSPIQIIIVLGIVLLVFGPKRLPDLGRSLGSSIRGFRGSLEGDDAPSKDEVPPGLSADAATGDQQDAGVLSGEVVTDAEPVTSGRAA